MITKNILLQSVLTVVVVAVVAVMFGLFQAQSAVGSTVVGNDYQANQITSADIGTSSVKSLSGAVGSIVVASTSAAGAVNLYAISSSTSPTATSSNTLIFSFPSVTTDEGTYQFDVEFPGGILMEVQAGFNGNYIMTYR